MLEGLKTLHTSKTERVVRLFNTVGGIYAIQRIAHSEIIVRRPGDLLSSVEWYVHNLDNSSTLLAAVSPELCPEETLFLYFNLLKTSYLKKDSDSIFIPDSINNARQSRLDTNGHIVVPISIFNPLELHTAAQNYASFLKGKDVDKLRYCIPSKY